MSDQMADIEGAASAAPSQLHGSGLDLVVLTKVFPGGTVAVDDVNMHVDHGEYVVLLGPSGCGKTTTLRMIGGHEFPSQGDIVLDGQSLVDLPPSRNADPILNIQGESQIRGYRVIIGLTGPLSQPQSAAHRWTSPSPVFRRKAQQSLKRARGKCGLQGNERSTGHHHYRGTLIQLAANLRVAASAAGDVESRTAQIRGSLLDGDPEPSPATGRCRD